MTPSPLEDHELRQLRLRPRPRARSACARSLGDARPFSSATQARDHFSHALANASSQTAASTRPSSFRVGPGMALKTMTSAWEL